MQHPRLVLLALGLTAAPVFAHAQDPHAAATRANEIPAVVPTRPSATPVFWPHAVVASVERTTPMVMDERASTIEAISVALRDRVSIAHARSGYGVPAAHCRKASEGCDRRMQLFAEYIVSAAQAHGVDPWLLAAIAVRETMLNPFAVGTVGELGILQINPARRDAKQVRFMRDARYRKQCRSAPGACQREIVEHAAKILAANVNACHGRTRLALGAYNSGRCNRSKDYAQRVLQERNNLQTLARKLMRNAPAHVAPRLKSGALASNDATARGRTSFVSTLQ